MRNFMRRFFKGRYGFYGTDELTRFLLRLAIVLFILSLIIVPLSFLYYIAFIILGYSYFRLLSKNIEKRNRENELFKKNLRKLKTFFKRDR